MNQNCSVLKTSNFIGKKWTLLIFLELYKKSTPKRYNELLKRVNGITPKVLSQRLKEMVLNGLVKNSFDDTVTPFSSTYSLTPAGKDLISITMQYKKWVLKWKEKNKICEEMDCKKCPF
ncbi:MAG: helix-turn-helix transcriptional regulator [Nanoarchaeota archaeon]|nr:helix-turn-helix transcriptional regulator [Nanoarchaeota archaeon]